MIIRLLALGRYFSGGLCRRRDAAPDIYLIPGDAARAGFLADYRAQLMPFAEHLRWTDTWVKMPFGKWQLVASHYSAVK